MARGFGATSEVAGYLEDVGRKLCISAVARIYQPGCKVDEVVVLTGKEGVKKSTSLRALAAGWFSDAHIDIKSKDGLMAIAGVWFFELAELDSVKKADHTAVRRFISSQIDRYRPPYGAAMLDRPRQGVLVGSTNEPEFLTDPHGSRRFVPVPVHQTDPEWIVENLDQLWAEAVVLYRKDVPWHYFEGDGSLARMKLASEQHRSEEPWRPKIEAYLYDYKARPIPDLVSPYDILTSPLGLEKPAYQLNRSDTSTCIRILEDLGCKAYQPPAKNGVRPSRLYRVPDTYLKGLPNPGNATFPLPGGQGGQQLPVDFGAPRKTDT
jgi:predicted P-loop ATPase